MHFDDRLATVLRHRATGEAVAATQFRQLVDLLGETGRGADESLVEAAFRRLDALDEILPFARLIAIARESSARIRNPQLVIWFAARDADIAAAALARAHLHEDQWAQIIPQLPIRARGLLRHRRDLPPGAIRVLDRLGARDRVLPEPPAPAPPPLDLDELGEDTSEAEPAGREDTAPAVETGIGAIVRRIEEFQRARDNAGERTADGNESGEAPLLPLGDASARDQTARQARTAFLFSTDSSGRIDWAEPAVAPQLIGTELATAPALHFGAASGNFADSFARRRPVRDAQIELAGAPPVAGCWQVDAAPRFSAGDGRFTGFVGRLRRRPAAEAAAPATPAADRLRQLLHELRTPVNAIQGFAEVIQQQVFGPAPHEYRALAATIAGDAARILAGFEELERLARLESGQVDPVAGSADFTAIAQQQIAHLQPVLSTRVARFVAEWDGTAFQVALPREKAEMLAWRVLGTLAAVTGAGETIAIDLAAKEGMLELEAALPSALDTAADIFSAETRPTGGSVGVGLFGAGFAFRLARAEARAAGGDLERADSCLRLSLPLATQPIENGDPVTAPNGTFG